MPRGLALALQSVAVICRFSSRSFRQRPAAEAIYLIVNQHEYQILAKMKRRA
jgi:hypothetical protein